MFQVTSEIESANLTVNSNGDAYSAVQKNDPTTAFEILTNELDKHHSELDQETRNSIAREQIAYWIQEFFTAV